MHFQGNREHEEEVHSNNLHPHENVSVINAKEELESGITPTDNNHILLSHLSN